MEAVKKIVLLLLVHMAFFLEIKAAGEIISSSDGGFHYRYLGCYRDRPSARALPKLYFNAKKYVNWKVKGYNFKTVINMCAAHALNTSDVFVFGVQHFGECWGSSKETGYDVYKESKQCFYGVGGKWTNAVYELVYECEANGMKYKDGQTFYIPQNPIVYNDMGCQICSCDRGAKNCYGRASCDFFFPCEKFVPAAQGKCCPTCACYHKNKYYKDGQTWINKQPNSCYECACVSSQTKCKVVQCAANCPNPVYEPGKCCPTCNPGAPITLEPAIEVTEPTTRPPPLLPPGFPGNHKRGLKIKEKDEERQ